jgi:hypothetical protein
MSTSKRGALDDMSEQNDDVNLSGAPSPLHAARTRGDDPCPTMSCACTGEFHSTTPPTAPEAEQIRKVRKISGATDVEQDMDARGPDIVHTLHTVRLSRFETPYARALYSSQSNPCAYCASADSFAQILPSEVLHFVQETAQRLLQVVDGVFERSPTRLVKEITDDLLIEIRQAVISAGDAAQPKLSRLAQKRLMLWVVVDAVRSPVVLSGAAADRVGGRIWKQAQRVSDALTATALQHASQRDAARVAAAADPSLEAGLAMKLAAITTAEEKRCNDLLREVYTHCKITLLFTLGVTRKV